MAEAAALMYFTGDPEGFLATDGVSLAGQMGVTSTAGLAGLAGGATTLLNGGSLMDAVKSGGMMYLGTQGIEALGGSVPTGNTPDVNFDTPARALSGAENASLVPKNVSQFTVPTSITDTELGQAGLDRAYTTTPLQAPVAPVDQFAAQNNGLINGTYGQTPTLSGVNTGYGFDNNSTGYIGENSYREGLAAGKGALGSSSSGPSTGFFSGLKNKFMALPGYQQAGIGAAGLLALKGMAKNNTVTKPTDNRKIKYYGGNPYSGAGFMRETPVLAASGGIVALANGGDVQKFPDGGPVFVSDGSGEGVYMTPSQMASYSGDSVYAPAIAALNANAPAPTAPVVAAPTVTAPATQSAAVQAAINAGKKGFVPGTSAQDVITNFNLNQDQAAQVAQALGYTGDLGGLNYGATASAAPTTTTTTTANPSGLAGLAAISASITGNPNATFAQAGQVAIDKTYLNTIMNPTAGDLASLNGATAADKAALINKAINAANNVYGGNNAVSQKVIAQLMDVWKINPDTVQSALGSAYTGPSVQSLYNAVDPALAVGVIPSYVNQGSFYTGPVEKTDTTNTNTNTNTNTVTADPNTLASSLGLPKGTYKTVSDVYGAYATSLGLPPGKYNSLADIKTAIAALSVTPKTPTPTTPPVNLAPVVNLAPTTTTTPSLDKNGYYVPATAPTTTNNGQTYNAGYISNTANPTTAQGVGGSHAFVNPNGYISQAPAMPFRPIGGYGTLQAAKDAYTKAGGSLGYTSPKAQTVTTEEATQHYLDMLSGKKPMSKVPYTPTGEIAKPYYTSVMGMAENPRYTVSQPKIYDAASRRYVDNPNYDPAFSATADYVGDAQTGLSQKTKDFFKASGTKDPSVDTKTLDKAVATSNAATSEDGTPADFDSAAYLSAHPDVAAEVASGKLSSAYQHYLLYGAQGSKIKDPAYAYTKKAAGGGLMALAAGGMPGIGTLGGYSDGGRLLRGPGDGISDSIPATIGARNPQPARLADGEFVVPARIVSELGNGSTEAGARKLYQMMDRVQNARKKTTGKKQVASNPRAEQYLPA
jgi:hypothetical protein